MTRLFGQQRKQGWLGTGALAGLCALLIGIGAVLAPAPTMSDSDSRPRYSKQEIRRAISFYAKQYRLDPALLRAVIKAESDFNPNAVSRKGAVGLMQIMPATASSLRVGDLFDPVQNIRAGAKQLRRLLSRYHGNLTLTLAAYNAGVRRVRGDRVPQIRETRAYVRKVLRYYRHFKASQEQQKKIDSAQSQRDQSRTLGS